MKGNRKLVAVGSVLLCLVAGLVLTRDAGIYAAFAAACVGAGGWFFKSNVDEHKAGGGP